MSEHSKDMGGSEPGETSRPAGEKIQIQDLRAKTFKNWKSNIETLSEKDRELLLVIYQIGSKFNVKSKLNDQENKFEKTLTKYYISFNKEGQLVAVEGKNSYVLEGSTWVVPAETLEILNKPPATKK